MNRSEEQFKRLAEVRGCKVAKSSQDEDMHGHFDFWVDEKRYEVKGLKRISRRDEYANDHFIWLEIQNVRGDKGWLHGSADFIAFERFGGDFIVCDRLALKKLAAELVSTQIVDAPDKALYNLYSRRKYGRVDLTTMVKMTDIYLNIRVEEWKSKLN